MSNSTPILEVKSLVKTIHSGTHEVRILRGLDFAIPRGQFAAIRGPSGSGKSTLLGRLLDSVGLADRHDHYPIQLSGGEQQRVALARAFVSRPPLILADEPTGNLDTANGAHVLEMLEQLNRQEGTTLVLVTHDESLAARADRVITLQDGEIVADEFTASASNAHASPSLA